MLVAPGPVAPAAPDPLAADIRSLISKGARNFGPPLRPTRHVKSVATGVVFAWSDSFRGHASEFVNCDGSGNADPEAWAAEVLPDYEAAADDDGWRAPTAPVPAPAPASAPAPAFPGPDPSPFLALGK
jgi:hypothetical protein